MIVTLQTERVRTLDQVRAFVEGSEAVDFTGADRESIYEFVRWALVRLGYERLGKSDKGLVKRYLMKMTGLSRAQLTRLIGRHRETERIKDRRSGAPACPFERRYTRADIRQLATLGQMSGPAHGGGRTRATHSPIGHRRKPQPDGQPGYVRVDTVHLRCRRTASSFSSRRAFPHVHRPSEHRDYPPARAPDKARCLSNRYHPCSNSVIRYRFSCGVRTWGTDE